MINKIPHHIEILLNEYTKRKVSNPRYSLRAFAHFLGMSSPTLSRVLSYNQDISLTACKSIIKKLKLSEQEILVFIRSVAEEKSNKAYRTLSHVIGSHPIYPYDRNLLFVCNLDDHCLYVNYAVSKIPHLSLEKQMNSIMERLGFKEEVVNFIESCRRKVISHGEPLKHNLPLETTVGTLIIESLFSPLMGKDGQIEAVASLLQNLCSEVLSGPVS